MRVSNDVTQPFLKKQSHLLSPSANVYTSSVIALGAWTILMEQVCTPGRPFIFLAHDRSGNLSLSLSRVLKDAPWG